MPYVCNSWTWVSKSEEGLDKYLTKLHTKLIISRTSPTTLVCLALYRMVKYWKIRKLIWRRILLEPAVQHNKFFNSINYSFMVDFFTWNALVRFNGYNIGTKIIAEAQNANAPPKACHNSSAPCWYISAVFPRIKIADIKDMKIEAATGNTDSCLFPTKYSLQWIHR